MKRIIAALSVAAVVVIASASSADTFNIQLVSETETTVTLGWTPQPGYGYLFTSAGVLRSRTNDPTRSSVRFAKVDPPSYDVDVIVKGANGHYPAEPPPPPKAQCEDLIDNDGDGKIDFPADPGCTASTDNDETDVVQPPPTGNLFVTSGGNDAAACTQSAPCRSFNRAVSVAQCGDKVLVANGTYPTQSITTTTPQCPEANPVHVVGESQAGVVVFRVEIADPNGTGVEANRPGWFEVSTMTVQQVTIVYFGKGIVTKINGGAFNNTRGDTRSSGNDWGPCASSPGTSVPFCGTQNLIDMPRSYVMDGDTVHDYPITSGGDHWECTFVNGAAGPVVIRNSRFWGCVTYDIYLTGFGGSSYDNGSFLIENNWFGRACNNLCDNEGVTNRISAINLGGDAPATAVKNVLIRFNSFAPGSTLVTEGGASRTNVRAVGNIFGFIDSGSCNIAGVTWAYNVWLGSGTCGTGGANVSSLPYENPSAYAPMNYHLAGTSAIDNFVPLGVTDSNLGVDWDGQARPIGPARDAGADER